MRVSIVECKKRLGALWFVGSGLIFFLIFFQAIFERYGDASSEAWGWFVPNIVPTLSLMLGVLIMDARQQKPNNQTVDKFIFRLSFLMSIMYLSTITLTILIQPFSELPPLKVLEESNLWLRPFQGLISACIGAFFGSQEAKKTPAETIKPEETTVR